MIIWPALLRSPADSVLEHVFIKVRKHQASTAPFDVAKPASALVMIHPVLVPDLQPPDPGVRLTCSCSGTRTLSNAICVCL